MDSAPRGTQRVLTRWRADLTTLARRRRALTPREVAQLALPPEVPHNPLLSPTLAPIILRGLLTLLDGRQRTALARRRGLDAKTLTALVHDPGLLGVAFEHAFLARDSDGSEWLLDQSGKRLVLVSAAAYVPDPFLRLAWNGHEETLDLRKPLEEETLPKIERLIRARVRELREYAREHRRVPLLAEFGRSGETRSPGRPRGTTSPRRRGAVLTEAEERALAVAAGGYRSRFGTPRRFFTAEGRAYCKAHHSDVEPVRRKLHARRDRMRLLHRALARYAAR